MVKSTLTFRERSGLFLILIFVLTSMLAGCLLPTALALRSPEKTAQSNYLKTEFEGGRFVRYFYDKTNGSTYKVDATSTNQVMRLIAINLLIAAVAAFIFYARRAGFIEGIKGILATLGIAIFAVIFPGLFGVALLRDSGDQLWTYIWGLYLFVAVISLVLAGLIHPDTFQHRAGSN